ncbi:MAG: FAD-binding oxidoreductase [Alphaproteobacteria bacterium]|nr:FAD-binding oxidoreductase [Alphaproteobacteria bacterium]
MRYDVVICGGGIMGSSIAYWLGARGLGDRAAVIEPDATYEFASAPRSAGGVRVLFSLPENIRICLFGRDFYAAFNATMAVGGEQPEINFKRQGYLFIAPETGADAIVANWKTQTAEGAKEVQLLDGAALKRIFPSLNCDDITAAAYSPLDGWVDPYAAIQGMRRKSRADGVHWIAGRAAAIEQEHGRASGVRLASGERIAAERVVVAAGAWSPTLCDTVGLNTPVEPMKRYAHYLESQTETEPLPLIKDPFHLGFRPEGRGWYAGVPNYDQQAGIDFEVDHGWFESAVWPKIAHRVPALEAVKLKRSWAGLYEQNRLDGNGIIGAWGEGGPNGYGRGLSNLFLCFGFSGHGVMQAPAAGRAIAELLVDGRFTTLDLANLGWRRCAEGRPYAERGIV